MHFGPTLKVSVTEAVNASSEPINPSKDEKRKHALLSGVSDKSNTNAIIISLLTPSSNNPIYGINVRNSLRK